MDTTRRTEQGFTLIEVMVAMVVLSLALLEIGRIQLTALHTTSRANRSSRAITVAQDRVERLLALQATSPLLVDDTPVGLRTTHIDPDPPTGYTVRWEVDKDNPIDDFRTVHVHVQVIWRNLGLRKTFQVSLQRQEIAVP